ncbi:cation:proton antiporter [Myxococcota bacterium]|nr:cation:proton antiporter [Myxococcota bacterium]MBU1381857.1 cation:proton antiporter [Myxococcota bacterium]MBU1495592.1 cation:proton antiporter [Myxococcota bacterium]
MPSGFLAAGLLLALALVLGRAFARFHLPRVTGYLLAGLVAGPSLAQILKFEPVISQKTLDSIQFISSIGITFIMFQVGSYFPLGVFRKYGHRIFLASIIESSLTFFLVFSIVFLFGFGLIPSMFLAIMSVQTAPGATQMVLRELRSEGELSDLTLILIGINNLTALILFIIAFKFFGNSSVITESLLWQIGSPLAGGVTAGIIISYWEQRLTGETERQLMIISMLLLLVWASYHFHFNLLFGALIAGVSVINFSPHEKRIFNDLKKLDYPVYVLFFALAGTHLHLQAIPVMGAIGVAFILMRGVGKYLGNRIGAMAGQFSDNIRNNLGGSMLCQAGVAIGLAEIVAKSMGKTGVAIQDIVLAAVIVFEIIGPIMVRISMIRAGETTIISMLTSRAPVGIFEGVHDLVNHFTAALGLKLHGDMKSPGDMPIKLVMRRHVESIPEDMHFDDVLKTMGHSRYDRLPVVDKQNHLVGIIHYSDISSVLFVEDLRQLVVARDIAVPPVAHLKDSDPLEKAMDSFRQYPHISYLFIVSERDGKTLAGVIRHNDALCAHGDV